MPDPTLSAAIAEAYASAPVGQVIWHTLEIHHPSFSQPIRVVCDETALDARIEAGAARDAGAVVTFVAYPFEIVLPDQSTTASPVCTLEIDNVSREIGVQLDAAILAGGAVEVIYRQYLSGYQLVGPENQPPLTMELKSVQMRRKRIRATIGFEDLLTRAYPRQTYDVETFPGLVP